MWENVNLFDVTAGYKDISTPVAEIHGMINALGWQVDSLDFSNNKFVAKASDEHGEKLEATGHTEPMALANLYRMIERYSGMFTPFNSRVASYTDDFTDLIEDIAQEYCDIKSYEKKAAAAWMELAEDSRRRVDVIREHIDIEITDAPMPYASYSEMAEDILENQHFTVSRANASHPIWSINQVVDFRIAHDILGHAASGGDWSWFGINRAFRAHASLLSYTAQKALFTETIGQGAFHYHYGSYATSKIAFLSIFDHANESEPYKHPVHPSQTVVPKAMTKIPYDEIIEKFGSIDNAADPNDGYETGIEPMDNNAYIWHRTNIDGQMVDPLHSTAYDNVVGGIRSNWHQLDDASQEQAVANAFRNAILKPGKHERAHAQHYQAVNHFPGSVDDPARYWSSILDDRDAHNVSRGYLDINNQFDPYLMPLKRHIKFINPQLEDNEISELADHHLLNMRIEEEREAKKKLGNDAGAEDIHKEATRRLLKRLAHIDRDKPREDYDFDENRVYYSKHSDPAIYPSPLAHHVKPIADISRNIKHVTKSAQDDLAKGGKGHHFRSSLMKEDFAKDLDPHQIDEAWYYLSPETSQLGAIDPDVLKILGHKMDDMNPRDYFKFERELQAARDASGYGHMPLGKFTKALKNAAHQSPGHHPDKKHLHNLHPVSHHNIDWEKREPKSVKPRIPKWFNDTKKARKEVGKDWDRAEGISYSKESIPFKQANDGAAFSTFLMPFYNHPDSNQKVQGQPGQTLMQHMVESLALSTPEIWALNPETGKEVANSES